jgi:excisionase family DNA binding protein
MTTTGPPGKKGGLVLSGLFVLPSRRITMGMHGTNEERFIRIDELAREARVSVSTIRHWLRIGRLPSVKLGKRRFVPREAFEQMVASGSLSNP